MDLETALPRAIVAALRADITQAAFDAACGSGERVFERPPRAARAHEAWILLGECQYLVEPAGGGDCGARAAEAFVSLDFYGRNGRSQIRALMAAARAALDAPIMIEGGWSVIVHEVRACREFGEDAAEGARGVLTMRYEVDGGNGPHAAVEAQ